MDRPTWVMVVGVAGIVLGSFGILGSGQTLIMPAILKLEKGIFSAVERDLDRQREAYEKRFANLTTCPPQETSCGKKACPTPPPKEMFAFMNDLWDAPDWFGVWSVFAGAVGLLVSGFYIFASVWFLLMKKNAVKMFYWAAGVGIAFSAVKGIVGVIATPLLGVSMLVWSFAWIIFSVVLIVVVATSDRSVFGKKLMDS